MIRSIKLMRDSGATFDTWRAEVQKPDGTRVVGPSRQTPQEAIDALDLEKIEREYAERSKWWG